ncbi:hypothetical protein [Comamonas guangdongensis]|uniref:Uncharacterized protein n=1 Tax=Comamonas guangdongensis TaxID=510515 RepID=A0ABV3ZXE0_9BURK
MEQDQTPTINAGEARPATETPAENSAVGAVAGRFGLWLEQARRMLERAQQRIGDNFRVPPNGG